MPISPGSKIKFGSTVIKVPVRLTKFYDEVKTAVIGQIKLGYVCYTSVRTLIVWDYKIVDGIVTSIF